MEFINGFFCGTLVMSLLFLAYAMLVDTGKKEDETNNEKK